MSVESALAQLNISIYKKSKRNVLTRCFINPVHEDSDPSCSVNLDTGIIKCFGCKQSTNIIKVYQQRFNIAKYKDAEDLVFGNNFKSSASKLKQIKKEKKKSTFTYNLDDLLLTDIRNLDMPYIHSRGWTQKYIDDFNIKLCISDNYMDYAITPLISEKLNIHTFEARKVFELEYLQKLFKSKSNSLERLRARFKQDKALYKDSIYYDYLIRSKVLYPPNCKNINLIYNYDNLDFNEELILVEGLASVAKIYYNISKNVTCCFGSSATEAQMNLLKKFNKRIIVLSDCDIASYTYIHFLSQYLNNIYVFDCNTDDTYDTFVKDIKGCKLLPAHEYVLKKSPELLIKENY